MGRLLRHSASTSAAIVADHPDNTLLLLEDGKDGANLQEASACVQADDGSTFHQLMTLLPHFCNFQLKSAQMIEFTTICHRACRGLSRPLSFCVLHFCLPRCYCLLF